ncbi:MAG: ABC-2 family transporter protein [Methanocella sp. PtaU1.Bin125]|nr:MAG: ABC-2 family transporter protein [Methanocella sp. PtaU1.Bin125]
MVRLLTEVKYSLLSFFRNKGAVFWTLLFPIVILLLLGYVMGGGDGSYVLYYNDSDNSQTSRGILQALNNTTVIELKDGAGMDLQQQLKDGKISIYLEIQAGFEQGIVQAKMAGGNATAPALQIYYDKSRPSSLALISILNEVINGLNMRLANAVPVVGAQAHDVATQSVSYFAFLLPGIIGMSIMSSAVNGTVGMMAHNRATGVFRKLATTPISRVVWNAGRIIQMTIILMISTAIAMVAGYMAFGVVPNVNPMMVVMIVAGGAVFSGLGMIIASFIKDEETAANAASALTFPLMFVSGSFFPVEQMPWFLRYLAMVSPLTYLNDGLRSSMITGNNEVALFSLAVVGAVGVVLFVVGVLVMKWKED